MQTASHQSKSSFDTAVKPCVIQEPIIKASIAFNINGLGLDKRTVNTGRLWSMFPFMLTDGSVTKRVLVAQTVSVWTSPACGPIRQTASHLHHNNKVQTAIHPHTRNQLPLLLRILVLIFLLLICAYCTIGPLLAPNLYIH